MHDALAKLTTELDQVASFCRKQNQPAGTTTMKEAWGWNFPIFSREDLAGFSEQLSQKIKDLAIESIEDQQAKGINELVRRLQLFKADTMVHMFDGNGIAAVPIYRALIGHCDLVLSDLDGWTGPNALHKKQAELNKRLGTIRARYLSIERESDDLEGKVKAINDARKAAEEMPETLNTLARVSREVQGFRDKALTQQEEVSILREESNVIYQELLVQKKEAEKILSAAATALSAATSTGMSKSFSDRARQLQRSMQLWVGGLASALAVAVCIGMVRFEKLSEALGKASAPWYTIVIELLMAALGIAAPVWFAWLASKRAAHLFKLAEDYSYKASVAQAYEGFRLETVKYDNKMAETLLTSAMARLDEEPLRYVDRENHASPFSEFASSEIVTTAARTVPHILGTGNGAAERASSRPGVEAKAGS